MSDNAPQSLSEEPAANAAGTARRGPTWIGVIAIAAAAALISGLIAVAVGQGAGDEPTSSAPADDSEDAGAPPVQGSSSAEPDWTGVAEAIGPSTVSISVATEQAAGSGSGFVLDAEGHIVTNHHVIAGAGPSPQIMVTFEDSTTHQAEVVGSDPSTDIGVLRLVSPPEDLQPAQLGDSDGVEVGQPAMAIGAPLGLQNSYTTGIVSATDRPVVTEQTTLEEIPEEELFPQRGPGADTLPQSAATETAFISAIQTDAAINQGNSGGALVDAQGYVIGVNAAIATAGQSAGSVGLGFAIPINLVDQIAQQLIETGEASYAVLGVTVSNGGAVIDDVVFSGGEVQEVPEGSPAADAGLQSGDLIYRVDEVATPSSTALTSYIRSQTIGGEHEIHFVRDGEQQTATVTLDQESE